MPFRFRGVVYHRLAGANEISESFLGVGEFCHDSLSAEAVAMIWTSTWILQSNMACEFEVFYDNCTIGHFMSGQAQWNCTWEYSQLKNVLSALRSCFHVAAIPVQHSHVKSHSGSPWNELVDSVAKAAVKGTLPMLSLPVQVAKALRHPKIAYMWMELAPSGTVPRPLAMHAAFKCEGPFPPRIEDTTWNYPVASSDAKVVSIHLKLGTINVLTLDPGTKVAQQKGLLQQGRIASLQGQVSEQAIHFIGLQECRTQHANTRHSATHLVFQSGATPTGTHGCELWVDRQTPYASGANKQYRFSPEHFHIAHADPRCLYAEVNAPHLRLRLLVIHAPHQASTKPGFQEWWNELSDIVTRATASIPLVVLADTNSHIGSICSHSVSSHQQDIESATGHCFHGFLMEHALWVPSTDECCHTGSAHTFMASEGSCHRLDFVCIPQAWQQFDVTSQVCYDLDFATAKHDHFLALVTVKFAHGPSSHKTQTKPRIDVRKCTDASLRDKFAHYTRHPPHIPWHTGASYHAEVLTSWLQKGVQECFAPDKSLPRQRYLSEDTWSIIQMRKYLHNMSRQSERLSARLVLSWIFQVWRQPTRHVSGVPCPDSFAAYCQMQQKCDQIQWWAIVERRNLHTIARWSSRNDRLESAKQIAENFLHAAANGTSQAVYKALKPLLGQQHRKGSMQYRPIPAVRLQDGQLAATQQEAQARWQDHFAQPEAGIPVTHAQLQELAALQAPRYDPLALQFALSTVPTSAEVIQFIQKAKRRKAPGLDGLPAEIYQLDPVAFAHLYLPLLMKCSIRCTEPVRWKGGSVCALPKTHTARFDADQFRSILLADFSSKLYHGVLRQKLLPAFESYRLVMQAGGVPGLGTDILNLYIQSFTQLCAGRGVSHALLFVDVKQAFYRACRPFVVGRKSMSETAIVNLFLHCGWSPALYQDFRSHIFERAALTAAHVEPHLEAQVNAILSGTWFQLRDMPQTLTSTNTGTRPGDSLADLLYGFLMGRFLKQLLVRFQGNGLTSMLPLKWLPCPAMSPEDLPTPELFQACWVDDLVVLLEASQCEQLLQKLRRAISLIQDCAAEFGLTLNYGKNKTSALVMLKGPHAHKSWKHLLAPDPQNPGLDFDCISLSMPGHLALVPDYVYLGSLIDGSGHPAAEVKRRFLSLQAPRRLLTRGIFRSPRMPQQTKVMLFQSLLMSKLLFSSGAWQSMHIQTQRSWHSKLMHLYASIAPTLKRADGISTLDLLADVGLASPRLVLAIQRVRLFARVIQSEMVELFAVLQAQQEDTSWLQMICQDITQFARIVPLTELDHPTQTVTPRALANYAFEHSRFLPLLCKKVITAYQSYLRLWRDFRQFQAAYDSEATAFGITWHSAIAPRSTEAFYSCDHCSATFPSFHGLCTHVWKQHQVAAVAQRYATGSTCRACLKRYDGRQQLIHHLRYFRTGCLLKLIATKLPMNDEDLEAIQQEDLAKIHATKRSQRKERHRHPVHRVAGPLMPWPWQRSMHFLRIDSRIVPVVIPNELEEWLSEVLQAVPTQDIHAIFQMLQQQPCRGELIHLITDAFVDFYHPEENVHSMEWYLQLQEALSLWQTAHLLPDHNPCCPVTLSVCQVSLTQVRVPPVAVPDQIPDMTQRRQCFADTHWNITDVPSQLRTQLHKHQQRQYVFPLPRAPPQHAEPIFLYVFSGRRREGDYQHHVMTKLAARQLPGQVLLLDLALSPKHDVTNPTLVPRLLSWFAEGAIAGLLVAPPCETWTEVRWESLGNAAFPRPLRTAMDPFCLPALTHKELQQLEVSNYLLYVAIRLFLAAIYTSTPGICEHPRQPKCAERASIWMLPWLRHLLNSPYASQELIWQAQYGAASPKPTHLGICHLPNFHSVMRNHKMPTDWSSLRTLRGKNEDGTWATTAAKEYPQQLNKALAELHVSAMQHNQHMAHGTRITSPTIAAQFAELYAGNLPFTEQTVNPDYHGPRQWDRADHH